MVSRPGGLHLYVNVTELHLKTVSNNTSVELLYIPQLSSIKTEIKILSHSLEYTVTQQKYYLILF